MYFLLVGHFHPHIEDRHRLGVQADFNEHMMQEHPRIRLAGPLKDKNGRWTGHAFIVETDTEDEAQRFAEHSPYHKAGFYERFDVSQFDVSAGAFA